MPATEDREQRMMLGSFGKAGSKMQMNREGRRSYVKVASVELLRRADSGPRAALRPLFGAGQFPTQVMQRDIPTPFDHWFLEKSDECFEVQHDEHGRYAIVGYARVMGESWRAMTGSDVISAYFQLGYS